MRRLVVCADGTWTSRDAGSGATHVEGLHDAVLTVTADGRALRTHENVHPTTVERHRRLTAPPRGPYAPGNLPAFLSRTARAQRDGAHESTPARRSTPAGD
jgi:hypothetical protein